MVIGIGHDLCDITRIAAAMDGRLREKFLARILTAAELELAEDCRGTRLHQFVAGRFAAKESIAKAFGCGIGSELGFADIEIGRDKKGKPCCKLSAEGAARLGFRKEEIRIHITITHERELASAFAVVERIMQ
ncbi:holo-ACP synthase [Paenibacillus sp. HB172176]|uniref:holo-ACP synthase n=1 Tax=Paenibacillus sp. HB172176 TaxID=2493690 RepID=UPI00143B8C17|nr:holo-ACP synthase [Paenibacillus sp. HB172176]